ncbi:diguanylate cyclase (GGDEF)-like protein/PAS domain S-box-containing protein [Duganella sp. SG902]|uniref:putative bifunctional diguanylate cyclase/phosphodiesterase n=1 Tax=Duganella sp. SG902 TaxID=2587016 RepID=UPI00159EA6BA|nr:EAL domain-containing protein [Duganella sp. SG902]NVM77401.1 diguanylate cyclase (GGDEF)-like protein/PAS domain S-box-containing protein [Duganella sp. SG902]
MTNVIAPGLAPDILLQQIYLNVRDFAIFTMDTQGRVTSWNLGAELIFGFAPDEIIGQNVACLFTAEDQRDGEQWLEMELAAKCDRASDYRWHQRKDHSMFWADGVLTPIPGGDGQPSGYLKILRDITERKLAQDEIRRLATVDVLTGLANRAAFDARRSEMVSLAERTGQQLLLLMVDLDQFKEVNDMLGHQAGDQLLQQAAQRIRAVSRESDYIARLGGDEFALLQPYAPSPASGGVLAEKLLQEMAQAFMINGREIKISASIGIAVCPVDATSPDALLKKADLALYHAKNAGRNRYHYYTQALDEIAHRKSADHNELRHVLRTGSYWLEYQPILTADGRPFAMEALLRLPDFLGQQPVEYVIGLAGELGALPELGKGVLRRACAQLRHWRDAGLRGLRICINTCAKELLDKDYLAQIDVVMAESGLAAGDVEIELTERDAIELERNGSHMIEQLRLRGFMVSLDDFGTGYSSLSYLRALPVNTIKLDKSFLRGVPGNDDANAVVRMVIRLAQDLRLNVVAEGVENIEQATFLGDAGCTAFQGYLYSPALNPDDATDWLRDHGAP